MSSPPPRKSSGQFANLMTSKRDPTNAAHAARRASVTDQSTARTGVLGNLWNSFARGHENPSSSAQSASGAQGSPPKQKLHRTGAGTLG